MRQRTVQIPALQDATYDGKPAPGWTSFTVFKCQRCRRIRQSTSAFTTGYGRTASNKKHCFACCGELDLKRLTKDSTITLYLVRKNGRYTVQNWPGTLSIPAFVKEGRHNIAGKRFDAWFSYQGVQWHGVNLGDNDILRCKRVKSV